MQKIFELKWLREHSRLQSISKLYLCSLGKYIINFEEIIVKQISQKHSVHTLTNNKSGP